MSSLEAALQKFEATEANLEKLEKLWAKIYELIPDGPAFGAPPEYDEYCMTFRRILPALPAIDGKRVEDRLHDYDWIGQMHFDVLELDELDAKVAAQNTIEEQGKELRRYRLLLNAKRRQLVRDRLLILSDEADEVLRVLSLPNDAALNKPVISPEWTRFTNCIREIETLLGGNPKPSGWNGLQRHLYFGLNCDLRDIWNFDWPTVKNDLRAKLYGEDDPIPVDVSDLGDIVAARPSGPVTSELNWLKLNDEDFERLIFSLISVTPNYENPQWLQNTHAADRGRDLSVTKVDTDPLEGVRRHRVIIQCKHWLTRSVGPGDVSDLRSQMELWQPPRVDRLIIATTGRFTADAIDLIEKHNQSDRALHISMWPNSHLESLLASRPHLIGEFRLRLSH
jgi:hypothetical protein